MIEQKIKFKGIKIFLDGANLIQITESSKNPIIQGFTTNPTLMRQAGVEDYLLFATQVLKEVQDLPISFEVFADDFEEMRRQAFKLKELASNVYVKIPVTNSLGEESYGLIKDLSGEGVKLNVTAVFDLDQVHQVAKALRNDHGNSSILSIFAGRIADTGRDPIPHMKEAITICRSVDPNIQLLWASPREVLNIYQADEIGCDIITVTGDIIDKLKNYDKDLRKFSLETVKMFLRDAENAGYKL